jgi:hypothetical protein
MSFTGNLSKKYHSLVENRGPIGEIESKAKELWEEEEEREWLVQCWGMLNSCQE